MGHAVDHIGAHLLSKLSDFAWLVAFGLFWWARRFLGLGWWRRHSRDHWRRIRPGWTWWMSCYRIDRRLTIHRRRTPSRLLWLHVRVISIGRGRAKGKTHGGLPAKETIPLKTQMSPRPKVRSASRYMIRIALKAKPSGHQKNAPKEQRLHLTLSFVECSYTNLKLSANDSSSARTHSALGGADGATVWVRSFCRSAVICVWLSAVTNLLSANAFKIRSASEKRNPCRSCWPAISTMYTQGNNSRRKLKSQSHWIFIKEDRPVSICFLVTCWSLTGFLFDDTRKLRSSRLVIWLSQY